MYKGRILTFIMFMLIGVTVITACFTQLSWADEKELAFDQYKADYYLD